MKKKIVVGIVLVLSLSICIGIYGLNVTKENVIITGIDGKTITASVDVDSNKMTNNSDSKSVTIENSKSEILDNNVENQLSSQDCSSNTDTNGQNIKATLSLEDEHIIKDFSYVVDMNKWGNILFCPCLPNEKKQDINCYLVDADETIVCILPSVNANNILDSDLAEFLEIEDIAFEDINGDGMTDVVMIISYMNVNQSVKRRIRIYLNGEEEFCLDKSFMDQYNYEDNMDSIDINKLISKYIRDGFRYSDNLGEGKKSDHQ